MNSVMSKQVRQFKLNRARWEKGSEYVPILFCPNLYWLRAGQECAARRRGNKHPSSNTVLRRTVKTEKQCVIGLGWRRSDYHRRSKPSVTQRQIIQLSELNIRKK